MNVYGTIKFDVSKTTQREHDSNHSSWSKTIVYLKKHLFTYKQSLSSQLW